ncbi:DctP family TRAP transporter solute-binding subunit [Halobacillus rhizosphaerae]|uniref:DctP family TRAP transporter solute-binding subunit n=1 Tax=Halobacillus rhizosphaerae TaxID=3064889 RepID=UPI00398B9136
MRTIMAITLFILTGILTALFFGFDFSKAANSLEYDDEQEGMKDEIVIKFSHVAAENTPKGRAARKFASLVQERTRGKIKVQIFANGSLYNDQNEYQALLDGHVQMIAPATSKLTKHYPKWQVLDLPFAFPTQKAVQEAYEGKIGNILLNTLDSDHVKGLTFWYNGYKQITNDEKPIILPEDFTRMHFRIMPSPVIKSQFKMLDASTSVLPFNKVYRNLEVQFIDGEENTFSNIYTKKLYRHQKYLTISNHAYLGYVVLMNGKFWNRLSPENKKIINQALKETTEWNHRHSIETNDQQKRYLMKTNALKIHYLTNEEEKRWKEALGPVYHKAAPIVGKKLMNEVDRLQKKYSY